jgi:DNA invertase Pin-like site-specific DNA recombinase
MHPLRDKQVVAYIRVSSDQQDSTRQRQSIDSWALSKGVAISDYFTDDVGRNPRDGASKRISFQRMLSAIAGGSIDAIVVDSQDRFGTKDAPQFWRFIDELREQGCELWSVAQGNLSSSDDANILTATIGAVTSTREVKEKGKRSLGGKIKLARAGLYVGGYPAFGLDVVCHSLSGAERWRLVWLGHSRRIKVSPDGSEQEYVGKHNTPAKDPTDTLRLVPTIREERIAAIRRAFDWYASEAISPGQIANRLNEANVDPVFGPQWEKVRVKELLRNPVYIGFPTINKRGAAKYWEFVDGQEREVISGKKPKTSRRRSTSDHITAAKPVFAPIVDVERFNAVQRKLEAESKRYLAANGKQKSPRTASFWLRNIVRCSRCGLPMRAWNATGSANPFRSYFCANYGQFGKNNPSGCGSHRIKAELIEGIVDAYLKETQTKISGLIAAQHRQDLSVLSPMESNLRSQADRLQKLDKEMVSRIRRFEEMSGTEALSEIAMQVGKPTRLRTVTISRVTDVYRFIFQSQKPELVKQLSEVDAEHTELVDRVLSLPRTAKAAIEKANRKIGELEIRIAEMKSELTNLADSVDEVIRELKRRRTAIDHARQCLTDDSSFRRKRELVSQVIDRIDCHFEATKGTGRQPRSRLVLVEIIPVSGDVSRIYPDGNKPAKG